MRHELRQTLQLPVLQMFCTNVGVWAPVFTTCHLGEAKNLGSNLDRPGTEID